MLTWEVLYKALPFILLGVGVLIWVGFASDHEFKNRPETMNYD